MAGQRIVLAVAGTALLLFQSAGCTPPLKRLQTALNLGYGAHARALVRDDPGLWKQIAASYRPVIVQAALKGFHDIVVLALEHGENINARDARGRTALSVAPFASYENATLTALLLIARGAEVNALDSRGYTPLMQAAFGGQPAIVEALLAHGAKIDWVAKDGKRALDPVSYLGATAGRRRCAELVRAGPIRGRRANYEGYLQRREKLRALTAKLAELKLRAERMPSATVTTTRVEGGESRQFTEYTDVGVWRGVKKTPTTEVTTRRFDKNRAFAISAAKAKVAALEAKLAALKATPPPATVPAR